MNRFSRPGVVTAIMQVCLLAGVASVAGCVEVDGGAVEVGWDLRFPDGRRTDGDGDSVSCRREGLWHMALSLQPMSDTALVDGGVDPCAGLTHCRFSCSSQGVGTTDFVLQPGQYAMRLRVLGGSGQDLGPAQGVLTPGAMVRQVVLGEITNLSVHLVVVDPEKRSSRAGGANTDAR